MQHNISMALIFMTFLFTGATAANEGTPRSPRKHREESLIKSLLNCPMCNAGESVSCINKCRHRADGSWSVCIPECIHNPLIRDTFLRMVPDSHHGDSQVIKNAGEGENMGDIGRQPGEPRLMSLLRRSRMMKAASDPGRRAARSAEL